MSRRAVFGLAAIAGVSACGHQASKTTSPAPTDDLKSIAADAYIFGFPLVLMDLTRTTSGPGNTFQHADTRPTPQDKQVVRLNLDTLYSQAWLDVRHEPMVLQVPVVDGGRYWLMQLLDAWSNTVHNPSSVRPQLRSGATDGPFTYAITGPGWTGRLPDGVTALPVPTDTVWLIGRIESKGLSDLDTVQALQQQLQLVPLSAWTNGTRTAAAATGGLNRADPSKTLADLDSRTYFNRLCALLAANPPAVADADACKRFARIGIAPGGHVDRLPVADLDAAVAQARARIPAYHDPHTMLENEWAYAPDIGAYGTDYLLRARTAWQGLGANLPEDAIYPTYFGTADTDGEPQRFRLRFSPGQTPPVDAFWSLTAYDADGFLVPNAANIYSVGHEIPIVPDDDGTAIIAIQHDNPGVGARDGNWLPIPATGEFSLTLRLYAPKPEARNGTWQVPALARIM